MLTPPDWITLRIFLAAVEFGSVTRAADHYGIATSAAAKRVQDLETEYGVLLLERSARGVRPTTAGETLARHASILLDLATRLGDDLQAFAAGSLGNVRLHATASAIIGHGIAEVQAAFAASHPRIKVDLREETSTAIVRDLLNGHADVGIITSGVRVAKSLDAFRWREDHLLAVMRADHPLAARASVSFAEVLAEPLVGVLVLEGGALALLLEEQAQRLGRRPHYSFRVVSPDAARRLVAGGHGVTIMPDGVAHPYDAALGLRSVPLAERWAQRQLSLVTRPAKTLSAPTRLLLEHLLRSAPTEDG
jgi:DNA-binding transcriptional LysR family regulator